MNKPEEGKSTRAAALGEEPIPRLVLRFGTATLAALLLNSVYNLTDALFVSWGVGNDAMGGVSVAFPFVLLQAAISAALGGGAASLVSRRMGTGERSEAGEVTVNAMAAFYSTAVITTALGFLFIDPLLNVMGVTAELYPFARQYLVIILAGNIFSTGFSSIIRAEGRMLYGLLIWVIPITLNIALDAVFILGLGMGVRGAAAATVIGQIVSFGMCVLFFTRFSEQRFQGAKISIKRIAEIITIGIPSLIQMGSLSIVSVIFNQALRAVGGTMGVTTYGYISKIIQFAIVPFMALTQALAPIAGYNYGTGNRTRIHQAIRFCAGASLVYAIAAFALVTLIPQQLLRLFTANAGIIALGTGGLRIIAFSFFFQPLPLLMGAAYQAVGNKLWALILYAANLVFLVPAVRVLSGLAGLTGVWWAYVLSNACASALAATRLAATRPAIDNAAKTL